MSAALVLRPAHLRLVRSAEVKPVSYAARARAELEASIGRKLTEAELSVLGALAEDRSRPANAAAKILKGLRELRESASPWAQRVAAELSAAGSELESLARWLPGRSRALGENTSLVAFVDYPKFLGTGRWASLTELALLSIVVTGPSKKANDWETALELALGAAQKARARQGQGKWERDMEAVEERLRSYRSSLERKRAELLVWIDALDTSHVDELVALAVALEDTERAIESIPLDEHGQHVARHT